MTGTEFKINPGRKLNSIHSETLLLEVQYELNDQLPVPASRKGQKGRDSWEAAHGAV